MEHCFDFLDAPVARVGSLETPIPFVKALEDQYLPKKRFENKLLELLAY
jgi:2-oxoisovalerate dehydrogenase E1 component